MKKASPNLRELIEFEVAAVEKGYQLVMNRPLFHESPTLIFCYNDLLSGNKNAIGNMSAHVREFNLRSDEAEAISPLLFLAAFKILDMTVEHLLDIDPYDRPVSFRSRSGQTDGKIDRIKLEFKGSKLGFDNESAAWLGRFYEYLVSLRNPAVHKKIEKRGALENSEATVKFIEAVYWIINQESEIEAKRSRAIFETKQNAKIGLFTNAQTVIVPKRHFALVKVTGEIPGDVSYECLKSLCKRKLAEIYSEDAFGFFLIPQVPAKYETR